MGLGTLMTSFGSVWECVEDSTVTHDNIFAMEHRFGIGENTENTNGHVVAVDTRSRFCFSFLCRGVDRLPCRVV